MVYFVYIISLLFLVSPDPIKDKHYTFHSVSVVKGDGAFSLLRRYNLNPSACNIDQFYELNDLDKNAYLMTGKKYKLPVYIFEYDGISIRSTVGIDSWDMAIRIKEYNEYLLTEGIRKKSYIESKILWVPHDVIFCNEKSTEAQPRKEDASREETLSPEIVEDDLYGKKYSKIEILDKSLDSKIFYILSGHGGPDPGAVCKECINTLCEDEYAYDVALRLARNLRQHSATVEVVIRDKDGIRDGKVFNCDSDEKLANGKRIPLSHRLRLKQRTVYVNEKYKDFKEKGLNDQYVVSIHVDSRSRNHKQDVFFCHYGKSKSGKKLATALQRKFNEKYKKHQKNRGYHGHIDQRSLYVLMNTLPPAVLIELGNIKNKSDHRRLLLKENRQALANWIYEGLAEHALSESK